MSARRPKVEPHDRIPEDMEIYLSIQTDFDTLQPKLVVKTVQIVEQPVKTVTPDITETPLWMFCWAMWAILLVSFVCEALEFFGR